MPSAIEEIIRNILAGVTLFRQAINVGRPLLHPLARSRAGEAQFVPGPFH